MLDEVSSGAEGSNDNSKEMVVKNTSKGSKKCTNNCSHQCKVCKPQDSKTFWKPVLHFNKLGKRLRDSCKFLKVKKNNNCDFSPNEQGFYNGMHYVAMDFTGKEGRVIKDPKEIEAVFISEAQKRNQKPLGPTLSRVSGILDTLDSSKHLEQPWFHPSVTRTRAERLLLRYSKDNGTFIIRECRSYAGSYVLSYIHSGKVIHSQILPMVFEENIYYTIDNGKIKFSDLIELIEHYRKEAGSLACNLYSYLAVSASPAPSSSSLDVPSESSPSPSPTDMDVVMTDGDSQNGSGTGEEKKDSTSETSKKAPVKYFVQIL